MKNRLFTEVVLVLALSALLTGCGTMQVRAGRKPDMQAVTKTLQIGVSTTQTVQAALGAPDGGGRSMMPWQPSPRTVWSYYYEEGEIDLGGGKSDDRRLFLYVFFDGDRYDGYMWFSSLRPPY
jgi:hypothetical protein